MDKFILIMIFIAGIFYHLIPIIKNGKRNEITFSLVIYITSFTIIMLRINGVRIPDPNLYIKEAIQYILK